MAQKSQSDLFGSETQGDMFGPAPVQDYTPDPDRVRARLHKILGEARAAEALPWEPAKLSLYQTIFPQMTNWLPDDEAKQLCSDFESELERLKAA